MKFLSEDKDIKNFFGVAPLLSTSIRVTKNCNLCCKHCYAEGGKQKENELTNEEIHDVLDQLKTLGVSDVFFTGGEPFIRKDMVDILNYARQCEFNTLVSTNGHFITEDIVEQLKKIKFKMLQISIDGTEQTHKKNRGTKSWDDSIKALKLFLEAGIENVTVGSVMLKDSDDLADIIMFCYEQKVPLFALMLLIEAGRAENMSGPSPKQMQSTLDAIFSNYLATNEAVEFSSNTTLPTALVPFFARQKGVHKKFACCSFPYILGIEANGDVAPCDGFFPYKEMILGNIREKTIQEIWESSPIIKEIRSISLKDMKGVCAKCIYLDYCAGGCRAAAYNKYHDLTMPDPACQNYYEAGLFPKDALK